MYLVTPILLFKLLNYLCTYVHMRICTSIIFLHFLVKATIPGKAKEEAVETTTAVENLQNLGYVTDDVKVRIYDTIVHLIRLHNMFTCT